MKKPDLNQLKKQIELDGDDETLWPILLDLTRVADKKITEQIARYKSDHGLKLTSREKADVRKYLLGLTAELPKHLPPISTGVLSSEDYQVALDLAVEGLKRNSDMLVGTLRSRLAPISPESHHDDYWRIISEKEKGLSHFSLIEVDHELANHEATLQDLIRQAHRELSNYHYVALIFRGASWSQIAKTALFMESMISEPNFRLFERTKNRKIDELEAFVSSNKNMVLTEELRHAISNFYQHVRAGFIFEDLIIVENADTKVLVMQKISLDDTVIPCPDCLSTQVRGNSYPKMLLRSFECHNPSCKSRSKIGRGKRYDLFNVKRNLKLARASKEDEVSPASRQKLRRDIVTTEDGLLGAIYDLYTWQGDRVNTYSISNTAPQATIQSRTFRHTEVQLWQGEPEITPLVNLLKAALASARTQKSKPTGTVQSTLYSIYNGNSTEILGSVQEPLKNAITSPPYYNAREYSQWPTLICYLIDMGLSAQAIFEATSEAGVYIYNIGDIVGQDNVYVSSHMSNRRLMLGFYSIALFELVGYRTLGNAVWDKGEVQSKRNSTDNPFPTYLRPINSYEHCLVFGKSLAAVNTIPAVMKLDPVRKINSKGENILGHTAPYPEKLVEALLSVIKTDDSYLLDPFLGSGTTVIACAKRGLKAVGVELDPTYFALAKERIAKELSKPYATVLPLFDVKLSFPTLET